MKIVSLCTRCIGNSFDDSRESLDRGSVFDGRSDDGNLSEVPRVGIRDLEASSRETSANLTLLIREGEDSQLALIHATGLKFISIGSWQSTNGAVSLFDLDFSRVLFFFFLITIVRILNFQDSRGILSYVSKSSSRILLPRSRRILHGILRFSGCFKISQNLFTFMGFSVPRNFSGSLESGFLGLLGFGTFKIFHNLLLHLRFQTFRVFLTRWPLYALYLWELFIFTSLDCLKLILF